jgi:hypothetical protein
MIKGIIIGVVLVALGLVFFTSSKETPDVVDNGSENGTEFNVQEYFNEKLQGGVIDTIGQPIEGFEPVMFMQVYSGLVPEDFDGVGASQGVYKVESGELTFTEDAGPMHSAAHAITNAGMKTLLSNLAERQNHQMNTKVDIDSLIFSISEVIDDQLFKCNPEDRDVDACIEIYQPVCGNVNVECVTTPCPPVKETFSNSCFACMNPRVDFYTEGECEL